MTLANVNKETDLFLVLYVDDFLMSGPTDNLAPMWDKIRKSLNINEPGPMSLYWDAFMRRAEFKSEGELSVP